MNNFKQNKKLKKYVKRTLLIIVTLLIVIATASFATLNNYLGKINKISLNNKNNLFLLNNNSKAKEYNDGSYIINESSTENENIDSSLDPFSEITPKTSGIENIAIFGIDGTEGEPCRSDCIMVLTIDNNHKKLKLTSIIRDSYVNIPTRTNKDKINHAYAFGGPSLAIQTLNSNFDLDISKFISVNFSSFPKIIDEIGGITLDIDPNELKYINDYIEQENLLNGTSSEKLTSTGLQTLDGTQTLAYSRIRYTEGGDFKRSYRQRTVIEKLLEKLKTLPITEYPSVMNDLLPLINTNLSNTDILSTALSMNSLKDNGIIQNRFPSDEDADGKMIDGIYYYVFDEASTLSKIHEFIYED